MIEDYAIFRTNKLYLIFFFLILALLCIFVIVYKNLGQIEENINVSVFYLFIIVICMTYIGYLLSFKIQIIKEDIIIRRFFVERRMKAICIKFIGKRTTNDSFKKTIGNRIIRFVDDNGEEREISITIIEKKDEFIERMKSINQAIDFNL